MKLRTHNPEISSSGIIEENAFTIVASAKAFKILSSSLYKNKILAIIRELACNACDAHISNCNPEIPFDIRLPTKLESTFKIRDFGTGLSHKDVMVLYTTYFNSTKTESNDQTGALGLGSKSPFSYTPAFNVTSFYGGMMRSYSAFLDDNGMPKIVMLFESPSSEANGIEISFPVQDEDHYEFRTNAYKALKHFKVMPNMLCGTVIEHAKYDAEYAEDDWQLLYTGNDRHIVQGNVQYPISIYDIKNFPGNLNCFRNMSIVFHFPIGTVEFAASREELSYDDHNSKLIIDKFQNIYKILVQEINDRISNCNTKWEAQVVLNEIQSSNYNLHEVLNSKRWEYKGEEISVKGAVDLTEEYKSIPLYILGENKRGYYTTARRRSNTKIIKISEESGIIFNDLKSNFVQRIKIYKESDNYKRVYEFRVGFDYDPGIVDNILESLGYPPHVFASDIELPPRVKTARLYNVPEFNTGDTVFDIEYFEAVDIDKFDSKYYIPMNGRKLSDDIDMDLCDLGDIVEYAKDLNIIESNESVFGFQKSVMKYVDLDYHVDFLEYMIKSVKKSNMWKQLVKYHKIPVTDGVCNSYFMKNIKDILKHTIVTDPSYIKMLKQYKQHYDFKMNSTLFSFNRLVKLLGIEFNHLQTDKNYIEIVHNTYPILERIIQPGTYKEETIFNEFEIYVQNMHEKSLSMLTNNI